MGDIITGNCFARIFYINLPKPNRAFQLADMCCSKHLLALFALYNCRAYITYNLQVKIALVLDNEKLEYPPGNVIVYWSDVVSIDYTRSRGGGFIEYITITTKSGSNSIETRLIAGSSNDIYKTVFYYYNNCL